MDEHTSHELAYKKGYEKGKQDAAKVVRKPLRVEITTDDFTDKDLAKEKGYYRKHYFCPACDIEIGHKTFDKHRQFGQGTVLHSNNFPNFCPCCGADIREPPKGD